MPTRPILPAMLPTMLLALLAAPAASAQAPAPVTSPGGLWRTIDDKTGRESGAVRIVETNGTLYGNIERITDPARAKLTCTNCTDDRKGKPLIGLNIVRGLKPDGAGWSGGTIVDPESGSIYKSSMKLEDCGRKLSVRGYLGISLFGRSQTWLRAE